MYTAVLMFAMTTGAETVDHGRRNCHGCSGCCSGAYVASSSCCGGSYAGCCGGGSYRAGYGGAYGPSPYYASGNYYAPNAVAQGASTDVRRSYYLDPANQNAARIRLLLPNSDAEVWFDGAPTRQRGMERTYFSPALAPGSYEYTIKGRWTEDGRTVNRERTVEVQPGQPPLTVDFRINPSEKLPAPKTTTGKPAG